MKGNTLLLNFNALRTMAPMDNKNNDLLVDQIEIYFGMLL